MVEGAGGAGGLHRAPPGLVVAVPGDGLGQALVEVVGGGPAELADPAGVQRVAPVVAWPVGHELDHVLAGAERGQDAAGQLQVGDLVAAADVVDGAGLAAPQHQVDGAAVVEHVQPVADVAAAAVQRHLVAVHQVGDEQRDDLLGELVGPVVVGAAGHHHVQLVGGGVGQGDQGAAGLAGRVRRGRLQPVVLGEGALADGAVLLVGADLEEAPDPGGAGRLGQGGHPDGVGPHRLQRLHDRAVDVGLGGEVDHHVVAGDGLGDLVGVADVALEEPVPGVALQVGDAGPWSRRR